MLIAAAAVVCVGGCAVPGSSPSQLVSTAREGYLPVSALRIVDCLLPGQIRKLGNMVYKTQRRPTRTTTADCEIRGGEYVAYDRADYRSALHVWMARAKEGDAKAQNYVGEIFEKGLGKTPDYVSAAAWYRRAAKQGYTRAMINLGFLYEKGQGVEKNTAKALNWYRRASGVTKAGDQIVWQSSVKAARNKLEAKLQQTREQVKVLRAQVDSVQDKRARLQRKLQQARDNSSDEQARALQTKLASAHTQIKTLQQLAARAKKDQQQASEDLEQLPESPPEAESKPQYRGIERANSVAPAVATPVGPSETQKARTVSTATRKAQNVANEQQPGGVTLGGIDFGKYYALIIGNQDYRFLPTLETPLNDARQVQQVLKNRYGFTTVVVADGTRKAILNALNDLYKVITPKDNLVVYYAGHGALTEPMNSVERLQRGYWLPIGAHRNQRNNWISNSAISAHLDRIKARAILVLADSCYAGAMASQGSALLLASAQSGLSAKTIKRGLSRQSRVVISSGGVKPVVDSVNSRHSLFAQALLEVLDSNHQVLRGNMLFARVAVEVRRQAAQADIDQIPQMRPIRAAGHAGGDFFFVPKGAQLLAHGDQEGRSRPQTHTAHRPMSNHVAHATPARENVGQLQSAG